MFQGKTRVINIPEEIGTKYNFVGIAFLDDRSGQKTANIYHAKQNPEDANLEILK